MIGDQCRPPSFVARHGNYQVPAHSMPLDSRRCATRVPFARNRTSMPRAGRHSEVSSSMCATRSLHVTKPRHARSEGALPAGQCLQSRCPHANGTGTCPFHGPRDQWSMRQEVGPNAGLPSPSQSLAGASAAEIRCFECLAEHGPNPSTCRPRIAQGHPIRTHADERSTQRISDCSTAATAQ